MNKQVVFITGASSGFGKGTAEALLAKGYTVYPAARRIEKMEDLKQQGAHPLQMDVTDTQSVNAGIEQIIQEQGHIDIVFNNAGYGSYGMIEDVPLDELEYQYNVNVFGVARVLKAVLPQMRQQGSGRIINTSSVVAHISTLGLGWYASTKHAVHGMTVALRQEVKDLGIKVILIEPGTVATGFEDTAINMLDKLTPPEDYQALQDAFKTFILKNYADAPNEDSTVTAMVEAAVSPNPKLVYRTTQDARLIPIIQSIMPDTLFDNFIISRVKGTSKK